MATINFSANGYNGEVLEDFLVYTAQGNETYEEGLIHIVPGIQKKKTLPHIQLGSIIQDNKPTPTSTQGGAGLNGENTYNISERYLEPQASSIPATSRTTGSLSNPKESSFSANSTRRFRLRWHTCCLTRKTPTLASLSGVRARVVSMPPTSLTMPKTLRLVVRAMQAR